MRNKTKQFLPRVGCFLLACVVLAVVVGSATNIVKADAKRATNSYENSAAHQYIASAMRQCVDANRGVWGDQKADEISNLDIFQQAGNVTVGPGIKHYMQSNGWTGSGDIECSSNNSSVVKAFFSAFHDELGISQEDLNNEYLVSYLCEKGALKISDDGVAGTGECGVNGDRYDIDPDKLMGLVQTAYENWLATSEDATSAVGWENLNALGKEMSAQELYQLKYNDLVHGCGLSSNRADANDMEVRYINPETGIEEVRYMDMYRKAVLAVDIAYPIDHDGVNPTCIDLAKNFDSLADDFTKQLEIDQGKSCFDEGLAQGYFSEEQRRSISYSKLVTRDDKGEIVCKQYHTIDENGNDIIIDTQIEDYNQTLAPDAVDPYVEAETECYNNGTDEVGWIVCSVTKFLRKGLTNLYENVVVPFLELDADAFDMGSPVFVAWQRFQSIANIIFVIVLLLIIFSQITGYGIDNYGIKRMLPKVIVGAILVNLSFIICQLAVDLSNIIGVNINNMFEAMASTVAQTANSTAPVAFGSVDGAGEGTTTGAIIATTFGVGGIMAATATTWVPAMLIAVIPAIISMIISILFVFVILGARRAAAVILVVLSPLAFVCYMLPNTKRIFDRWISVFKAVLLVYPVCGLLMGGGAFAGAVLWKVSNGYFIGQILAALTTVIPFFFIPKVLKSSLAAFGNLGTTISNLGNALGGRAGNAIRNSEGYQAMQKRHAENVNRRRAGLNRDFSPNAIGRGKNWLARSRFGRAVGYDLVQQGRMASAFKTKETRDKMGKYTTGSFIQAKNQEIENEALAAETATEQALIESQPDFIGGNYDAVANQMVDLMKTDQNGENATKIRAAQDALNKVGDDGRTAMDKALAGMDFSSISSEARKAFASNAMDKHAAEWKNNARSLFEAAKANTGASASGNYNDFVPGGTNAAKITSYRPEQFANMDDGQFDHLMKEYRNYQHTLSTGGTLSADQQARLDGMQNIAAEVMSNPNLQGALKGQRAADVASMAGNVLNVRANQQADARASAQWRGVTDADLQNIVTDSRSTPQERAQAQAEINRRSGSSSP